MENAIVLKNIRRDIPAMKPLAAKVIQLHRLNLYLFIY